ncbi:hypothetical protein KKH23_04040 [Patescibacteria group bacterium]|nr:hypothetical protein [Patescibacteria group bacterium]MBU0776764.1 hypothetical protein [Patescibacteria group bacterium]MBU0846337.1 hypothetical protein [Patescibacteria group bacterium]MBU0922703.1 hypothetical protein [Patescibacteria group bacterium]MBU1066754.1 hypothetical protein [Patescibacteria group bacterium]
MEGVEASLKTQLKEARTALLGKELDIQNGETFRLSWSNLGYGSCIIGSRREKQKRDSSAHVNLVDIPSDPEGPKLSLQLAVDGWVNVMNKGNKSLKLSLSYPDEDHFRYVYTKDFTHKEADVKGIAVLQPGEMITTKHEGSLFKAEWEVGNKKVELGIRGVSIVLPIGTEQGIAINYKLGNIS